MIAGGGAPTRAVDRPLFFYFTRKVSMQRGIVAEWNEDKGFGFITPASGERPLFFHISDYSKQHRQPVEGLKVKYVREKDAKGRRCAADVRPAWGHKRVNRQLRQKMLSLTLFTGFTAFLFYLSHARLIPIEVVGGYALMSSIALLIYAKDKRAATRGEWRVSEGTLHALALAGGWPGAAIAQSFLRHKSTKVSFRAIYWITVFVNCWVLFWLTTPQGRLWMHGVLNGLGQ